MVIAGAIVGAFCSGCGNPPVERDPGRTAAEIERAFAFPLPTNAYRMNAASRMYRAHLDGGSENVESILRFELNSPALAAWRGSMTNFPEEYKMGPIVDPRFEKRFPWWDLNAFPRERFTHCFLEINNGSTDYRKLDVFILDLNPTNVVYISAFLLRR
jgi:hypothetical protein